METTTTQAKKHYLQFNLVAGAFLCLTWHHAIEGECPLTDKVLADGVMIPHEEAHQGQLRHVNRKHQSLFPHRVEPYIRKTSQAGPKRDGGRIGGGWGDHRKKEK